MYIDYQRGRMLAGLLWETFNTKGVFGRKEMPEDKPPENVERGSLEHLLFITLTVSIDYQRDAPALWESSRKTYEDPETRYLFNPKLLHQISFDKIVQDMRKYGLSQKTQKDAYIWRTIGVTFYKKWGGNPLNFLKQCNWDALIILEHLKNDIHIYRGEPVPDYPYLRGAKIGPVWLRMLRDNVGITKLKNLDKVPIPVDVHIARATLTTGVVRGSAKMTLEKMIKYIKNAWFESVKGLSVKNRPMVALDVDEPLWHLSKYGCSKHRDKFTGDCSRYDCCPAKEFCVKGMVKIENGLVELET